MMIPVLAVLLIIVLLVGSYGTTLMAQQQSVAITYPNTTAAAQFNSIIETAITTLGLFEYLAWLLAIAAIVVGVSFLILKVAR
jgi:hypothetical protein